jgi:16S rRNA (cytosine1402-N4)-methyltransferase
MVEEILEVLPLRPGAVVVDGTLGLGGHTSRFVELIKPAGVLIGLDWDESMLALARERLSDVQDVELHLEHRDFRSIGESLTEHKLQADGILLDLGLNSAQVDDPTRGMSFREEGPLDMRMDRTKGEPAAAMLNRMSPAQIEQILWDFGDERWAKAIAKQIVERRKRTPLQKTSDLVDSVLAAIPAKARDKRIHPATRTFQAVRIAVNGELEGLEEALEQAAACLAPEGVLAVLSYHSGEDRTVKHVFRRLDGEGFSDLLRKPQTPSDEEVRRNPRARSAKLRALKRTTP